MRGLIDSNMDLVYFISGQVFFATGLAIALKQKGLSSFRLGKYLWLLAMFFILFGVAEWTPLLIPEQIAGTDLSQYETIMKVQEMIRGISFAFLLVFAVLVLAPKITWSSRLRDYAAWYAVGWGAAVILGGFFFLPADSDESWVRFSLGIPATLLVATTFIVKRNDLRSFPSNRVRRGMVVSAVCFVLLALLSVLFIFAGGRTLDADGYLIDSGLLALVAFSRSILGLVIAISIVSVLSIFDVELHHRINQGEQQLALLEDRKRIARDLHDGTIQSIYAVGLQLEAASKESDIPSRKSDDYIRTVLDRLNDIISDIRNYIFELDFSENSKLMERQIREMVNGFAENNPLDIDLEIVGNGRGASLKLQHDVVMIVQECLSNILKHSLADHVYIGINMGDPIRMTVEDNGVGLAELTLSEAIKRGHGGLSNISKRIASYGGQFELDPFFKTGTRLHVSLPTGKSSEPERFMARNIQE